MRGGGRVARRAGGYKEIVVTGIEIASWGKNLKTAKRSSTRSGRRRGRAPARIHLGSLEPTVVTDSFVERLKKAQRLPISPCSPGATKRSRACAGSIRPRSFSPSPNGCARPSPAAHSRPISSPAFPARRREEFSRTLAFIEKMRLRANARVPVFPRHKGGDMVEKERAARALSECSRISHAHTVSRQKHDLSLGNEVRTQVAVPGS